MSVRPSFTRDDASFRAALRVAADGIVAKAETLPKSSDAARLLRDAATSLLDADTALEREGRACS